MSKRKRKVKTLPNVGRPSDYRPEEHPRAIRLLARKWMSQRDCAETLGISHTTFDNWMRDHPEFLAAYRAGREEGTDDVERSLLDRAKGYTHTSEKIVVVNGSVRRVKTVEQYPPDPSSAKFVLTNRRPKDWIEKSTVLHLDDRATRIAKARARVAKPKETTP